MYVLPPSRPMVPLMSLELQYQPRFPYKFKNIFWEDCPYLSCVWIVCFLLSGFLCPFIHLCVKSLSVLVWFKPLSPTWFWFCNYWVLWWLPSDSIKIFFLRYLRFKLIPTHLLLAILWCVVSWGGLNQVIFILGCCLVQKRSFCPICVPQSSHPWVMRLEVCCLPGHLNHAYWRCRVYLSCIASFSTSLMFAILPVPYAEVWIPA